MSDLSRRVTIGGIRFDSCFEFSTLKSSFRSFQKKSSLVAFISGSSLISHHVEKNLSVDVRMVNVRPFQLFSFIEIVGPPLYTSTQH